MRPRALRANKTLTPLEIAPLLLLLEEPLGEGVLVEDEPVGLEVGVEVKVTPCASLDKV